MRFLGIDPGLRITGYGCIEGVGFDVKLIEAGIFRLGKKAWGEDGQRPGGGELAPIPDRLAELDADLADLLHRLQPDAVCVEVVFSHIKHPATAIAMAHARGVILMGVRKAGIRLLELKPAEVKKFLTGHGQASKLQMQESVQGRLGLASRPEPPDVADAVAIALCACSRWDLAAVEP